MQIIKKSDFKSKIEFILEYLDHHKIIFEKEIFIYPENDETLKLKNYIEDTFKTKISIINKLKKFNKDDIYYIIFNSENRKDLEFLFNYNFDFTNILISSNTLVRGYRALLKAVEGSKLNSVLDIGCGDGIQGRIFSNYGKKVTGINLGYDELYNGKYLKSYGDIIIGDYLELDIKEKFDIIWLCHILEHIRDVEKFLIKLKKNINKGGTLAIIVPPNETDITVNHVHSFNTGRLLRYLVITGYDCRNISCFDYGYNKCLIINNIKFHNNNKNYITTEKEIKKAFKYLPEEITVNKLSDGNLIFNGNINKIN